MLGNFFANYARCRVNATARGLASNGGSRIDTLRDDVPPVVVEPLAERRSGLRPLDGSTSAPSTSAPVGSVELPQGEQDDSIDGPIKDLVIGGVAIGFPVVQAALSGYSDSPMRVLARRHGASY